MFDSAIFTLDASAVSGFAAALSGSLSGSGASGGSLDDAQRIDAIRALGSILRDNTELRWSRRYVTQRPELLKLQL